MTTMTATTSPAELATRFHEACMTGEGWAACKTYCVPGATLRHDTAMLAGIDTLAAYAEFLKSVHTFMPDFGFEVRSLGVDEERGRVLLHYGLWGTHTGEGGPQPPTGKRFVSESVLVFEFDDDRIRHVTKLWNDADTMRQAGWV